MALSESKTEARTSSLSREEEILAYSAIAVLLAAVGLVVGAIVTGA